MHFLYIYIYILPTILGSKTWKWNPHHYFLSYLSFSGMALSLSLSLSPSPSCRKLNVVIYSRFKFLFNLNIIQDIYIACFSSYNRITLESFWRRASCLAPFRRKCFDVRTLSLFAYSFLACHDLPCVKEKVTKQTNWW
jgi:hypothetical protein